MLAKVWKKALLAVCIIACIYNVMHKLVSRIPLELQLKSVQNQSSIIDMLNTTDDDTKQTNQNSSVINENTTQIINQEKDDEDSIVVIY